jgi:hypothetical protein
MREGERDLYSIEMYLKLRILKSQLNRYKKQACLGFSILSVYLRVLMQKYYSFGVRVRSLNVYHFEEIGMFTRTIAKRVYFSGSKRTALNYVFLGLLVLFLTAGVGDRAVAQSQADTVIDRLPETTAAVVRDQGNSLFLNQILYAGIIVWVISLLVGKQD